MKELDLKLFKEIN